MTEDQVASAGIVAEEFGSTATYTPFATGTPATIAAVMSCGTGIIRGELYELRDTAYVSESDVPLPVAGDALSAEGVSYTVDAWFRSGAMWQLILLPT